MDGNARRTSERLKRKKIADLKQELKKIKCEFRKVKAQHRCGIKSHGKDKLHSESHCSQENCPLKQSAHKIGVIEKQLNEVANEVKKTLEIEKQLNEIANVVKKRPKLSNLKDKGQKKKTVFKIENLPEDTIMEIFKHLSFDDLCRVGRVCKAWHRMTRCKIFWKKIQANIGGYGEYGSPIPEATFKLISILPAFVTSISLNFDDTRHWYIEFNKFSKKLKQKCPNLQILVLNHVTFEIETRELVNLFKDLPKKLRVLALPHCNFYSRGYSEEIKHTFFNVEVLDLSYCCLTVCNRYSFVHMPKLRKLRISGCEFLHDEFFEPIANFFNQLEVLDIERTPASELTFGSIAVNSQNLTELYACWTFIDDNDLNSIEEYKAFPCLKIICLRGCDVTNNGIFSLLKACPSLQKIFVGSKTSMAVEGSPPVNSEIVEDIGLGYCNHSKKVDYMLE